MLLLLQESKGCKFFDWVKASEEEALPGDSGSDMKSSSCILELKDLEFKEFELKEAQKKIQKMQKKLAEEKKCVKKLLFLLGLSTVVVAVLMTVIVVGK